jgi:ribosomal subunit interface protein
MRLELTASNLKLSDKYRLKVTNRFTKAIDKYLLHLNDDLKKGTIVITKNSRFGYECKFDMKLPFGHLFASARSQKLFAGLMDLRDRVKKQLRKDLDKLRNTY